MADTKTSGLAELAEAPASTDLFMVVDVSDTTMDAGGTNKKIQASNVRSGLATSTDLSNHTGDTTDAHDASAISVADSGGHFTATDVEAALTELAAGKSSSVQSINAQTGTTYTVALTDVDKIVTQSNSGAITTTLPHDSAVAVPVGAHVDFIQIGTGQVTFAASTGATVNGTPGLKLRAQWSAASAIKRAADTWVVVGDLST